MLGIGDVPSADDVKLASAEQQRDGHVPDTLDRAVFHDEVLV